VTPLQPEVSGAEDLLRGHKAHMRYLWGVGLALYLGAIFYVGWQGIGDALAAVEVRLILALMAVDATGLWIRALKWRLVLGPGRDAVSLFFLSKAAGGWSPGRVGELAPLLLRKHRTPRMAAWIVADRLIEITATLGLGLVGLLALAGLQGAHKLGMLGMVCAAIVVLVLTPLYLLTRRRLFLGLARRVREGSRVHRVCMLLAAVSDEIVGLGRLVPVTSALTVLASCMDIGIGVLLYLSFSYRVSFAIIAVAQCAHGISSAVPFLPNATGVPYAVAAEIIHEVGRVPWEVLLAAVGVRLATANGVFWAYFGLVGAAAVRVRQGASSDRETFPGGQRELARGRQRNQAEIFDQLAVRGRLYVYSSGALEKLNALVDRKGRLLDIGCGDGAIAAALDAERVVGLDVSPRCVALAAGRGTPAVVGDVLGGLPFAEAAFDTVYCIDVLHHLGRQWDAVFGQIDRVLRPGGTLVVVEPDARNPFIRWIQAPSSPIRAAPCDNEPAIDPVELLPHLNRLGYVHRQTPMRIEGLQVERGVFPLWQRLLKAPFVLVLAWWFRRRPNKFAIVAQKRKKTP